MRLHTRVFTIIALTVLISFSLENARAQDSGGGGSADKSWTSEFSTYVGTLLPYMINGVTEIQPFFGLRYAYSLPYGSVELDGASSHAHGVDYDLLSFSYRGEITPMPEFTTLFYIGPNWSRYKSAALNGATRSIFGFHLGAAGLVHIAGPAWFRTDMTFNSGPGTSLYLGFGLTLRTDLFGGGGGGS